MQISRAFCVLVIPERLITKQAQNTRTGHLPPKWSEGTRMERRKTFPTWKADMLTVHYPRYGTAHATMIMTFNGRSWKSTDLKVNRPTNTTLHRGEVLYLSFSYIHTYIHTYIYIPHRKSAQIKSILTRALGVRRNASAGMSILLHTRKRARAYTRSSVTHSYNVGRSFYCKDGDENYLVHRQHQMLSQPVSSFGDETCSAR